MTDIARYLASCASPGAIQAIDAMQRGIDARAILPTVSIPTLVLHRVDDAVGELAESSYIVGTDPGREARRAARERASAVLRRRRADRPRGRRVPRGHPSRRGGVRPFARDRPVHRHRRVPRARASELGDRAWAGAARAAPRDRPRDARRATAAPRSTPRATASSRRSTVRPGRSGARSRSNRRSSRRGWRCAPASTPGRSARSTATSGPRRRDRRPRRGVGRSVRGPGLADGAGPGGGLGLSFEDAGEHELKGVPRDLASVPSPSTCPRDDSRWNDDGDGPSPGRSLMSASPASS